MISETRNHILGRSFEEAALWRSGDERQKKDAQTSKAEGESRKRRIRLFHSRKLYRFEGSQATGSPHLVGV